MGKVELNNDAAILDIPETHNLIISTDTLNAGTHFIPNASPANIAHKALRTNISDIYAMGAKPYAYQLSLAFPERPTDQWFTEFTTALLKGQTQYSLFCSGGDTTSINGPLSISITIMGLAEKGTSYTRSGAQNGDNILLSGPVGDAYIGLQILQKKLTTKDDDYFINQYYKPEITPITSTHINAAIDISDGLIADLGHIATASNIQAKIQLKNIPLSPQAQKLNLPIESLLTGGDDYKLLLAASPNHTIEGTTIIGQFKTGTPTVQLHDKTGQIIPTKQTGWSHF